MSPVAPLRLLFIGIDGADWEILEPAIAKGRLPHMGRLATQSVRGTLQAPPPLISPVLWTTMLTGRHPEDHGILDFFTASRDGRAVPVPSSARRAKALWNILTDHGIPAGVVGFWATWPAEPIHGIMISDAFAPSLFRNEHQVAANLVHPRDWEGRLCPLREAPQDVSDLVRRFVAAGPGPTRPEASRGLIESDPAKHLESIIRSQLIYHRSALRVVDEGGVECLLVYHQMIDEVCHRFMRYAPPALPGVADEDIMRFSRAVDAAYELEDQLVGELLERASPETVVVLASDHGFLSGARRLRGDPSDFEGVAAAWHRPEGILLVRAPGVTSSEPLRGSLLDLLPTILSLLDLPMAADLPGRSLLGAPREPRLATYGAPEPSGVSEPPETEERVAHLAALGYVEPGDPARKISANGWVNLGLSLAHRRRLDEAREAYRRALDAFPDHPTALYNLASSLQEDGETADAFLFLVRLARLDTRLPTGSLTRLAACASSLGETAQAAAEAALQARPETRRGWEWHGSRASLLAARGARKAAIDEYVRAVELSPELGHPIVELLRLSPPGERETARILASRAIAAMASAAALEALPSALQTLQEPELAAQAKARLDEVRGR